MDLDALKGKQLDDQTLSELKQYVGDLTGQRDAARKESIEGRKTLRAERDDLAGLRDRLLAKLGIDSPDELDGLPDAKGQAEAVRQYEARLKKAERDYQQAVTERDGLRTKHRQTLLDAEIHRAIASQDWADSELAELMLRAKTSVDDEGNITWQADGKSLSLAEAAKTIATAKPLLLKSTRAGGSGFGTSGSSDSRANPWLTGNLTEQVKITRENPTLAAALRASAEGV